MKINSWFALFVVTSAFADVSAQESVIRPETRVEFAIKLSSLDTMFRSGEDAIVMTPQQASQPGLKISRDGLSLSLNSSLSSSKTNTGGLELSYAWGKSFAQLYSAWATGYEVKMNPDTPTRKVVGSRDGMTGTSEGFSYMYAAEEGSNFLMTDWSSPHDHESQKTPFQTYYHFLIDRSAFLDSSALVAGTTVRQKDRTFVLPGIGLMSSEAVPMGYAFTACSLGLGAVQEKMIHTSGISESKTDGAYSVTCLLNYVLQNIKPDVEGGTSRWYGGMSGSVQVLSPFNQEMLTQRLFLVNAYFGSKF